MVDFSWSIERKPQYPAEKEAVAAAALASNEEKSVTSLPIVNNMSSQHLFNKSLAILLEHSGFECKHHWSLVIPLSNQKTPPVPYGQTFPIATRRSAMEILLQVSLEYLESLCLRAKHLSEASQNKPSSQDLVGFILRSSAARSHSVQELENYICDTKIYEKYLRQLIDPSLATTEDQELFDEGSIPYEDPCSPVAADEPPAKKAKASTEDGAKNSSIPRVLTDDKDSEMESVTPQRSNHSLSEDKAPVAEERRKRLIRSPTTILEEDEDEDDVEEESTPRRRGRPSRKRGRKH